MNSIYCSDLDSHLSLVFMVSRRHSCSGDSPQRRIRTEWGTFVDIAAWVEVISAFLIGLGILTRLGAGAIVVTMIVGLLQRTREQRTMAPSVPPGDGGFAAHGGATVPMLWFLIAGIIGNSRKSQVGN